MLEFSNLRNYEVLNEVPRLTYIEADYIGAKNDYDKCIGYVQKSEKETMFIFSADRNEKTKTLFKESMLKQFLYQKDYEIVKIKSSSKDDCYLLSQSQM